MHNGPPARSLQGAALFMKGPWMPDLANPRRTTAESKQVGVRGWLLALCLMLTLVGPLIVTYLVATEYAAFVPDPARAFGQLAATLIALLMTVCSVAYGVYAGIQLWLIRPNAVWTAKKALLLGLSVDIVSTTVATAVGSASSTDGQFVNQILLSLIPSLVFFTLCFSYLNRSNRVHATYLATATDA